MDQVAGGKGLNLLVLKAEVQEGNAFARGGEQTAIETVAQRLDAQRVASDDHAAFGVQQHEAVGAVESLADGAQQVRRLGTLIAGQFPADLVHHDFRIGVARQVPLLAGQ